MSTRISRNLEMHWHTNLHEAVHHAQHMMSELNVEEVYYVRGNIYHYSSPYQIKGKVVNVKVK